MTEPTPTYEVRGPHVLLGQWYVWERPYARTPQLLSSHDTEEEARQAAVYWALRLIS
jgi:hypothetical protein